MTPVVLLHAFPLDRRLWEPQLGVLRSAGFTVAAPDLAGFGKSAVPSAPSLMRIMEPVLERLDGPAMFCGVSMGGYLIMDVLRKAPERVAGAVFIDTKATADNPTARATRFEMARAMESAQDLSARADAMLPNLLGATTLAQRPEVVATVREWIESADPAAVATAQRAMADRMDAVPFLRRYEGPAAVVWGSEDTVSPVAEQRIMLDAMPQAVAREIPGCGHLSPVEDPDALTDILLDILRDWIG